MFPHEMMQTTLLIQIFTEFGKVIMFHLIGPALGILLGILVQTMTAIDNMLLLHFLI